MIKDITMTQFFKIYAVLNNHKELTSGQIVELTGLPEMSVRTVLSKLAKHNSIESKHIYRLKK